MLMNNKAIAIFLLALMGHGDAANLRSSSSSSSPRTSERERPIRNVRPTTTTEVTRTSIRDAYTLDTASRQEIAQSYSTTETRENEGVEQNEKNNENDPFVADLEVADATGPINEVGDPFQANINDNPMDMTSQNDSDIQPFAPNNPNTNVDTATPTDEDTSPFRVNIDSTNEAPVQNDGHGNPLAPNNTPNNVPNSNVDSSETRDGDTDPFRVNVGDAILDSETQHDSDTSPFRAEETPNMGSSGQQTMEEASEVFDPFRANNNNANSIPGGADDRFDPFAIISTTTFAHGLIDGYNPNSPVEWAALSMDQELIEDDIAIDKEHEVLAAVQNLYSYGSHPLPVATVSLTESLAVSIAMGTQITAESQTQMAISGTIHEDYTGGANTLKIRYDTNDCLLSADACLAPQGEITIDKGRSLRTASATTSFTVDDYLNGESITPSILRISYTYDIQRDNINEAKTFKNVVGIASNQWLIAPSSESQFDKFMKYYGHYDYGNQLFDAISTGSNAKFLAAEMDFSNFSWQERRNGIAKVTVATNAWMGVVGNLEYAAENCNAESWDEAVGLYIGNEGSMLYGLANQECQQFGTCNNELEMATVNAKILGMMVDGQDQLQNNRCYHAKDTMKEIVQWMAVPLVQGTLRATRTMQEASEMDTKQESHVEGMVFAASVLPLVHECNARDASIIYESIQNGDSDVFDRVRASLEQHYECMGLSCDMVGSAMIDENGTVVSRCNASL